MSLSFKPDHELRFGHRRKRAVMGMARAGHDGIKLSDFLKHGADGSGIQEINANIS